MRLTKSNYERVKGYQTLEEALERVDLTPEEMAGEEMISVGIGIDLDGVKWYAIGHENEFTNCLISNLEDLSWYEEDWIEEEEV